MFRLVGNKKKYVYVLLSIISFVVMLSFLPIDLASLTSLVIGKFLYTSYIIEARLSKKGKSFNIARFIGVYYVFDLLILIFLIYNNIIIDNIDSVLIQNNLSLCGSVSIFDKLFNEVVISIYLGSLLFPSFILLLLDARKMNIYSKGFFYNIFPFIAIIVFLILIESYNIMLFSKSLKKFYLFTNGPITNPLSIIPIMASLSIYSMYVFSCLFLVIVVRFINDKNLTSKSDRKTIKTSKN